MQSDPAATGPRGKAPGGVGLLIIDMINAMTFEDAEALRPAAKCAAAAIRRLRDDADRTSTPVVYVNDNYGQWHSERARIVAHCLEGPGAEMVRLIEPRTNDYFITKPELSGFYATNLPVLLPQLGVERLILTGIAACMCVLFTAADAHMRAYDLWVPRDAVASSRAEHAEWATQLMQKGMGAELRGTQELTLAEWIRLAP